jgi:hypothetical protein
MNRNDFTYSLSFPIELTAEATFYTSTINVLFAILTGAPGTLTEIFRGFPQSLQISYTRINPKHDVTRNGV